ncbi:hypothetical protein F2P81_018474 [Scophthalmus maximus]|uniref:Uncharacterized protein n=1 Tax=Scophthalmus maximus TaxID=52904 RepID=A0A6A4S9X3_SCOMX|nr:hypothetical protein F2P81_018474 [Scophthalmus maximus]
MKSSRDVWRNGVSRGQSFRSHKQGPVTYHCALNFKERHISEFDKDYPAGIQRKIIREKNRTDSDVYSRKWSFSECIEVLRMGKLWGPLAGLSGVTACKRSQLNTALRHHTTERMLMMIKRGDASISASPGVSLAELCVTQKTERGRFSLTKKGEPYVCWHKEKNNSQFCVSS